MISAPLRRGRRIDWNCLTTLAGVLLLVLYKMIRRAVFILHFDINKTIMMSDPASGSDVEGMLNSVLSECVWGRAPREVDMSKVSTDMWEIYDCTPSPDPPHPDLISFGEFLENRTNATRAERKALKTTFTEDGNIGSRCRVHYDILLQKMKSSGNFHNDGNYLILPAFFRFLSTLSNSGLDYRIIFRTFGHDIASVSAEYNMFCRGEHPLFKCDRIGPNKALDSATSTGYLKRSEKGVQLTMNSQRTDQTGGGSEVHNGMVSIHSAIKRKLIEEDVQVLAIQDHFQYWHECGETDDSGKLLLISPEEEGQDIVQIFFDDNIERDRAHIVDVRDVSTEQPIPFKEASGKYIHRVAPLRVILDEDYFVEVFDSIMTRRGVDTTSGSV